LQDDFIRNFPAWIGPFPEPACFPPTFRQTDGNPAGKWMKADVLGKKKKASPANQRLSHACRNWLNWKISRSEKEEFDRDGN
jgi:hypothetical protein